MPLSRRDLRIQPTKPQRRWRFSPFLGLGVLAGVLLFGCAPFGEQQEDIPVEILGVQPEVGVGPHTPVRVVLSGRVYLEAQDESVRVEQEDGRVVPTESVRSFSGEAVELTPLFFWPPGRTLSVSMGPGLKDGFGRSVGLPSEALVFHTAPVAPSRPMVVVRSPTPGRLAPLNVSVLAVATISQEASFGPWSLRSEAHEVPLRLEENRNHDGVALLRLPPFEGPCKPLCPQKSYRLHGGEGIAAIQGVRGGVTTSTLSDVQSPAISAVHLVKKGDHLRVRLQASEPVVAWGHVLSGSKKEPMAPSLVASRNLVLKTLAPLVPDTRYEVVVNGQDLAGNAFSTQKLDGRAAPAASVKFSELVAVPLHDWSDSEPEGVPFDGLFGRGAVTEADEWVELVNLSDHPLDLRDADLRVRAIDGTPTETIVDERSARLFGDGGNLSQWWPGEALVIRLNGHLSQRDLRLELWAGSRLLDWLVLGDSFHADHVGGQPPHVLYEALARDKSGRLRWCVPSPGDPLPPAESLCE